MSIRAGIVARLRHDEGAAALEAAILAAVAILVLLAPTQVWLLSHARNVASGAAQVGAISARGQTARTDADTAARRYLANQKGLRGAQVSVARGQQLTVTVTGRALSLMPGIPLEVRQSATMPVERETLP